MTDSAGAFRTKSVAELEKGDWVKTTVPTPEGPMTLAAVVTSIVVVHPSIPAGSANLHLLVPKGAFPELRIDRLADLSETFVVLSDETSTDKA